MKHIGWLSIFLLLIAPVGLANDAELAEQRARLQALSGELEARREQAGGVAAELSRLERRMGEQRVALRDLDQQIATRQTELTKLEASVAAQAQAAQEDQAFLEAALRAAHRRGEVPHLALLLADEPPATRDRLVVYDRYLGEAIADRLQTARATLAALAQQREQLVAVQEKQRADRAEQADVLAALEAAAQEREAIAARLANEIGSDEAQLAEQRALVRALTAAQVSAAPPAPPPAPSASAPTQLRKGGTWPLDGPVLEQFGASRGAGLQWTGLLIGGEEGSAVQAVAPGTVVFAEWLRGLGLLLIIDHGNGELTLYGRNQALYVVVGDRVNAGDVVAAVGRTGGRAESALYFEVRANGEPINPVAWYEGR